MFNKFTTAGISHPAQGSAEFDGVSDYIDTGAVLAPTNHTISFWAYITGGTLGFIFDQRDADDDGIYILNLASGQIFYKVQNVVVQSPSTYQDEWVYLSATYDGSTLKLYADGSLVVSQSASLSVSVTQNALIGSQSYSLGAYYSGNLANVAIWNRALSSDEINSVMWKGYDALEASEKSGLQAWYSLDDVASPVASLATMEALAVDKDATIENKAAITAAINALS